MVYLEIEMPDYTMKPKRQVPQKATVRKFVSITPKKDEDGLSLQLRRYKEKENVGEAVIHMEPGTQPAEVKQLIEEFRNL